MKHRFRKKGGPTGSDLQSRDFLWLHLRELPYFRSLLRAVEAGFYQGRALPGPTLDIGCGDGHFATVAFQRRLEVGLDPQGRCAGEARRRGGYRDVVQANGDTIPFPDETFNSAVSNSVLEHIPQIDVVLSEVCRVLRPGSTFLFCVPNPEFLAELSVSGMLRWMRLRGLARAYEEWFRRISRVHHLDTPEVWRTRLERTGFQLEQWWHYFPPKALHVMEWGHYFGLPALLSRWVTGRWVLVPTRWNLALTERLVRPHAVSQPYAKGTFTFYVARKAEGADKIRP